MTATFPCGHPRTPENIKPMSGRSHGRCRTCQREWERVSQANRRALRKEETSAMVAG